jgi:hypothetical protein
MCPREIVSDVVELVAASVWYATTWATSLTNASAIAHPSMNGGPFTRARCEKRIRITAIIGTGLIATPTAKLRTSLMPRPTMRLLDP